MVRQHMVWYVCTRPVVQPIWHLYSTPGYGLICSPHDICMARHGVLCSMACYAGQYNDIARRPKNNAALLASAAYMASVWCGSHGMIIYRKAMVWLGMGYIAI